MRGLWQTVQKIVPSSRKLSSQNNNVISGGRRTRKSPSHSAFEQGKPRQAQIPIISCKNEQLNHYRGQLYNKFAAVPLASKGWHHRKSKGDFFEMSCFDEVPAVKDNQTSFQSLDIPSDILKILKENEITEPTVIQADGIKHILKGHHTLLAAETGSGKTLAYLLPLLTQICHYQSHIARDRMNSPFGLIITPSRELAHQIGEVAKLFSQHLGINIEVLTGGKTKRIILNPSFKEVDLLVASIGALRKLIATGIYRISHIRHIVLDEADTLLDDSFNGMLVHILERFSFLPLDSSISINKPCAQVTMAAATIPTSMNELLGQIIPVETLKQVTTKYLHCIQPHIPQKFIRLGRSQKPAVLLKIVKANAQIGNPTLIFSNKTPTCDWISMFLNENNMKCVNLNGDMHYNIRMGKFEEFQTGRVNILSCTDMGSRGLDTVRVQHLINYDFPIYMADYIHRCGRTGRIGSPKNCHITHFISGELEIDLVQKIELAMRRGEPLPNVNANIRKIIQHKYKSQMM